MKRKPFEKEANRLANALFFRIAFDDIGIIRRSLVRAYKRGVKAGLAQKERHVSHED
jgi:hypothetical protein